VNNKNILAPLILGLLLCTGLLLLGYFISNGFITMRAMDRTVTVKGLSEREVSADIAIWPIKFNEVSNDLGALYSAIEQKNKLVVNFLKENGIAENEISVSVPATMDRQAQEYRDTTRDQFRYFGSSTITVYSPKVDLIRDAMSKIVNLGKSGIAITGQNYETRTEFLFKKLNELKPDMIEEATRNAREVAEKFAKDSGSKLGKIKSAYQGQFSIMDRDSNTPYIKKVRVVSTVTYFLTD
jgi:uncharacterized protein